MIRLDSPARAAPPPVWTWASRATVRGGQPRGVTRCSTDYVRPVRRQVVALTAPVVDTENRLLGAVTVDDVLDHMLPPDWREHEHDEQVRDTG